MAVQQTAEQLLAAGVNPAAVQTLTADRPAVEARQFAASLEKDPIVASPAAPWEADPEVAPATPWEADLESDPLALWSDEVLSKDLKFDPTEHYIAKGGATAFDAKQAARLGKIRKGQAANRSFVGTAAEQISHIPAAVPKLIAGVGKGIAAGLHAGIINPLVQASALVGVDPGFLSEYEKLSEQQAAESLSGAVAETAGLAKGVGSLGKHISRATGLSKKWSEMTDEEAFRAIIDEGEKERELRAMAQGDIPALAPIREELAAQGTPVRPEAVQEATERGLVGWLGFGAGINLGGAAVKGALRGGVRAALPAIGAAERVAAADVALTAAKTAEGATAKTLGETTTATTALGGAEALVKQAADARTLWESAQSVVKTAEENLAKLSEAASTARGSGILAAVDKAAQLTSLRAAKDAALKAFQSGPKNAEREAALQSAQDAFKAAEEAIGESNLASAIELTTRARNAVSTFGESAVQNILGRPIQAAGALTEQAVKLSGRVPRVLSYAGAIGALFAGHPGPLVGVIAKELAGPIVQKAGAAVKGYGKAVATGEARRTLDVLGAVKDTAAGGLSQYPMDYAFAVGLSDTEQQARASAPIATALGVLPGAGRGVRRIVTGELITPKGAPTFKASPAYGENKVLDTAHATAMKTVDAKTSAQVNWVRELARKMGGRVYLMPDTATFESTLAEVYKQQNPGAEITPAIAAQLKQMADQQGLAFGEFRAADGELQPTVFIKNPESAVHEMGHILEKVVPESVNARLDEQILARLSPENLEAAGTYYAKRLGRTEPWREVLQQLNPELSAEQYLARELRAENLGVALKNRGEAFATSPGLYRWLAQTVAKIGDLQGIPLAQSESLGFPVFGDVMAKGEKAARNIIEDAAGRALIEARDVRLRKTPTVAPKRGRAELPIIDAEIVPTTAPEASRTAEGAKGEALATELAARDPAQADVLRKISSAISSGQALKVDYRSAPGEPAGSPNMSREARRAVIEAFRDMPESARPLWEKTSVPFRLETTKNKGVQVLTYSPEVFAANAHKLSRFIAEAGAQRLSPYEIDAATKTFTPDGWQKLYDDVATFTANQRAGGTGSGQPLKLPAGAAEMGVSVPALKESTLVALPQPTADFINVIFHLPPPETPRVSRKGGTPGNIVAQEIARANEPLIGPRVVEPGRARSEKEFKGFEGRKIQEVNPLRAELERAAVQAKLDYPSLIETNQRLNLEHLVDANPIPEVTAIRPVTDVLRAGFLPKAAGEANTSMWRKPVKTIGSEILAMTPDAFNEAIQTWRGGLTQEAQRVGLGVQTKEDVAALQQFSKDAQVKAAEALAEKDFDGAMSNASVSQFFREAVETATGTGSNGEYLRKNLGEAYKPPFPEGGAAVQAKLEISSQTQASEVAAVAAQYLPPTAEIVKSGKEYVTAPASKWKATGKIYLGVVHSDAMENALAEGILGRKYKSFTDLESAPESTFQRLESGFEHGFETSKGRFVSREEAAKIASAAQQLKGPPSFDLTEEGAKQLDAMDVQY